jgi:hypothetical protein
MEKETTNLIMQGIVIKPHYLLDVDPFDKLLDNHDHIDDVLSDPEVISVIQHHLMAIANATQEIPDDTDGLHVNALQSELVTPEELALGSFARQKLKTLSTWSGPSGWLAAEKKQLNQFHNIEMFGPPVDPPKGATILRPQWNFRIHARQFCDGSKCAATHLYYETDILASSLEHPMWRMFMGLYGGDVTDAYAHAPGPLKPTFRSWDDTKVEWWLAKTGEQVSKDKVLEILHTIQGHPEAGNAWEHFITGVLHSLGFHNTTHEKNIHQMTHEPSIILLARQVDDFALGCVDDETTRRITTLLGERIRLPCEP